MTNSAATGSPRAFLACLSDWKRHCCASATVSPARKRRKPAARQAVEGPERRPAVLERGPRGEGEEQEDEVLVRGDEGGVEDLEEDGAHARAEDGPAVVLGSPAVAALAGEVVREAHAPERGEQEHDVEARVAEAGLRGEPGDVERRGDGPEAVDLGAVAGDDGGEPAEGGEGGAGDSAGWRGEGRGMGVGPGYFGLSRSLRRFLPARPARAHDQAERLRFVADLRERLAWHVPGDHPSQARLPSQAPGAATPHGCRHGGGAHPAWSALGRRSPAQRFGNQPRATQWRAQPGTVSPSAALPCWAAVRVFTRARAKSRHTRLLGAGGTVWLDWQHSSHQLWIAGRGGPCQDAC